MKVKNFTDTQLIALARDIAGPNPGDFEGKFLRLLADRIEQANQTIDDVSRAETPIVIYDRTRDDG